MPKLPGEVPSGQTPTSGDRMRAIVTEGQLSQDGQELQENLPSLPQAQGDRFIPKLKAVRDHEGQIAHYILRSPGGTEIQYDPDDVEIVILKHTFAAITEDQWESLAPFDLAAQVKAQMKALGLGKNEIPRTPEELIMKAQELYSATNELQRTVLEGRGINFEQAIIELGIRVLRGGKREWQELNPIQKQIVMDTARTLMAHRLAKMGVDETAVRTAEIIEQVDQHLRQQQLNWLIVWGEQIGGGVGGLVQKLGERLNALVFGEEKALEGFLGAGAKTTIGMIEDTASLLGKAADGVSKRWKKKPGLPESEDSVQPPQI